jgi:hypothetical protein
MGYIANLLLRIVGTVVPHKKNVIWLYCTLFYFTYADSDKNIWLRPRVDGLLENKLQIIIQHEFLNMHIWIIVLFQLQNCLIAFAISRFDPSSERL